MFAGIVPTRHSVGSEKSNRVLGFPAMITSLCQFYGVPVALSRVIRPLLIGLSSRSTAPPGRRKARHHSSGQQTHRHRLQSPTQLIYKGWSVAYDTWPTSRRPTTRASTKRYWAHDRQIVIMRLAQDVKEALLGGNLIPFKFLLVI